MSDRLTPVAVLERLFGSPEAVSIAAGRHEKSAYKWRHPKPAAREAGDLPNPIVMRRLLAAARAGGWPLEAHHLIEGATEAEVERLLARQAGTQPVADPTAGSVAA